MLEPITPVECAGLIAKSRRVAALTGAGVSTAAGIPDFRGPAGLYTTRKYDPDTVFDLAFFFRNPQPFYDFTRDLFSALASLTPTFTHFFLRALEGTGKLTGVVTQNIDPLHQQAGSKSLICVHGNYFTSHCHACGAEVSLAQLQELVAARPVPYCACGGLIKPDVVFFGEAVARMDEAAELVRGCDLLLALGSSLAVYPAGGLPNLARQVVVVNQGAVSLRPGPGRWQSQQALDDFFRAVAAELALPVGA